MTPEHLSPVRVAAAIATRLAAAVPSGVSVRAEGSAINVYDPDSSGGSAAAVIVSDEDDRTAVERLENAAWAILNGVQDAVMESTRAPWPPGPGAGVEPGARVIGEQLHLWFGDEASPLLRLEPIALADLASGAA